MLNFPVKPNAPLLMRLDALLLPHATAPTHIANRIDIWREGKQIQEAVSELELVKHFDIHRRRLYGGAYQDVHERNFAIVEASQRCNAEYGLLRRFSSLHSLQACDLLSGEEVGLLESMITKARDQVLDHLWKPGKAPLRIPLRIHDIDEKPAPVWRAKPTAHHANMNVRH